MEEWKIGRRYSSFEFSLMSILFSGRSPGATSGDGSAAPSMSHVRRSTVDGIELVAVVFLTRNARKLHAGSNRRFLPWEIVRI